ncbi:MAG TPA: DUF1592 domain-containing protein [Pirellulales bacterium]
MCALVAPQSRRVLLAQQPTSPAEIQSAKPATAAEQSGGEQLNEKVLPLLSRYCYECHNSKKLVADLALDKFKTLDSILASRDTFELVTRYVHTYQMPPDEHPQPTETERATLCDWLNRQLHDYYAAHPDPGRVTLRRLNRNEYNNTIRDLVGVGFQPADDFPQDDSGYGFDNIGDVLSLAPVLLEKYLSAADRILDEAIPTAPPASKVRHFPATQTEIGFNAIGDRGDGWVQLISLEEDDVAVELPVQAGDYLVRVKAFCKPVGGSLVGQGSSVPVIPKGKPDPTKLGIFLGHTFCQDLQIDATEESPQVYEARIGVPAGKQRFSASVRRNRGSDNETYMLNGRIGKQQPGIVYVKWMEIEGPLPAATERAPAAKLQASEGALPQADGSLVLEHNSQAELTFDAPHEGEFILRAEACAQQAGSEPAKMEFRVNGQAVKQFDVLAPATLLPLPNQHLFDINLLNARPCIYEVRQKLPAGKATFAAAFTNDFEDKTASNPNLRDRNLILHHLEVVDLSRPLPLPPMPETFAAYFSKPPSDQSGDDDAREMLTKFARRAFRRPVKPGEIERLMSLYLMARNDGESFSNSLKVSLKAVLVSPKLLFHGELPQRGQSAEKAVSGQADSNPIHPIDEFALASRLSYFLWSSMPDDELLALAEQGKLRENLPAQVQRMVASPKAAALVSNFAGQWLQLRTLETLSPDKEMFRDYDDGLRKSMQRETELLFDRILHENRSVLEFLTADYTFVNGRLARFYGLEKALAEQTQGSKPVNGGKPAGANTAADDFQLISLVGTHRKGVLTQGSMLTLTSNPTRTSPVKRGKFVLENLLGTPPPPPPANVPKLEEQAKQSHGTLRQQMEQHRQDPLCASCHAQMDPIGFGLENFNAIGKWRETDGTAKVDSAGQLKSGEPFKDAVELADLLVAKRKNDFLHCLSEKMLTYALGRGIEPFDRPAVDAIVKNLAADDCRFQTLILEVVQSMPFQSERAADDAPPTN